MGVYSVAAVWSAAGSVAEIPESAVDDGVKDRLLDVLLVFVCQLIEPRKDVCADAD